MSACSPNLYNSLEMIRRTAACGLNNGEICPARQGEAHASLTRSTAKDEMGERMEWARPPGETMQLIHADRGTSSLDRVASNELSE